MCLTGPYFWVFAVTSEFLCTPGQARAGARYQLRPHWMPAPGLPVIARLRYSLLTAA